ncbi:MAG: ribosome biogenesis GTPase YqeH, partial [Candidatus Izimaplasma sp.]|nr:ribosome biogenesis GTPase YqeH [Candidatus Izimaplasma bacterium]
LKSYANSKDDVITVSQVPGTTLDFIKIPFNDSFIYDTPGLINDHQIMHSLSQEAIKTITPKKEIKPKVYQLNPKQSLFLGGLARIDFLQGDKTSFIVYASQALKIHRTKLEKADDLQKNRIKELLTPPFKNDDNLPLKRTRFTLKGPHKKDIVLPSVGFITITGKAQIDVYVSKKTIPYVRKALI